MVNGVSVLAILILFICPMKSQENFTVQWETSNPVVFGETVRLLCTITGIELCNENNIRTWTHGTDDDLIFVNGQLNQIIDDERKYVEKVDNPCKSFSLLITNFDESDAVDTYGCSFTVDTLMKRDRKTIALNETTFKYIPTSDMIKSVLMTSNGTFFYYVELKKVYPQPVCTVNTTMESHTSITYSLSKPYKASNTSIFYGERIIVFGSTNDSCSVRDIVIICKIGNQDVNIGDIKSGYDIERCSEKMKMSSWPLWIVLIAYQVNQAILSYDDSRWKHAIPMYLGSNVILAAMFASVFFSMDRKLTMIKRSLVFSFTYEDSWMQQLLVLLITIILLLWNNRKMLNCNIIEVGNHIGRYVTSFVFILTVIVNSDAFQSHLVLAIVIFTLTSTGGSRMFPEEKKEEAKDAKGDSDKSKVLSEIPEFQRIDIETPESSSQRNGRSEIASVKRDDEIYELSPLIANSNSLRDTNVHEDVNKVTMSGSYETAMVERGQL